jgi:hypothetical protein
LRFSLEKLYNCLAGRQRIKSSLCTKASIVVVLGRTIRRTTLNTQVVLADVSAAATAGPGDSGRVAKVVVDTDKVRGHAASANILNHDVARAVFPVVGAVTAAAVEFSRVGDSVVADRDAATSVVLDDLVVGASGTAAVDENLSWPKSTNSIYSS